MNTQVNSYLKNEPIGKLMFKFTIPSITALLVASLYNIVDQIFIGHGVGYLGNAATNVVYPITVISFAVAILVGDGCAAYLSICQGQQDIKKARKCVGNAVSLLILIALGMTILLFLLRHQVLWLFGATPKNIHYATSYFRFILLGIPFYMFSGAFASVIRADGSPRFAMFSTLTGCLLNVILDPIAIFVLHWGMSGAALATAIGQITVTMMHIYYLKHMKSFQLQKEDFKLDAKILKLELPLGISSFLTQLAITTNMTVMNNVIVHYGPSSQYGADIALSVMGIVQKVFGIVEGIIVGIAAGSQPIVGYNYGAREYDRVKAIYRTMMIAEVCVGLVATIFFQCFPLTIMNIFGSHKGLYNQFAVMALRTYLGAILLCALQKATSIFMQALAKPLLSLGLSLLRDFVLCVSLTILLPIHFGLVGVLYSAPVADVISFIAVVGVMFYIKKILKE